MRAPRALQGSVRPKKNTDPKVKIWTSQSRALRRLRLPQTRIPWRRDDALYRKVAWRLLPFLMVCYIAAFLDRVNVGFAKLQMLDDLKFSETVYGLGAGIFFIGYFLFEVPSNVLMHRIGAKKTLARIMILWGIISPPWP